MKKLALLIAALALVGCEKQGGTSDQYKTDTGRSSTNNVVPEIVPSATDTNSSSTPTPAP